MSSTYQLLTEKDLDKLDRTEVRNLLNRTKDFMFSGAPGSIDRSKYGKKRREAIIATIAAFKSAAYVGRVIRQKEKTYHQPGRELLKVLAHELNLNYYSDLTCGPKQTLRKDALHRLADKMALNLVDVSTPTGGQIDIPYADILSNNELVDRRVGSIVRERFVAVIGADASTAATPRDNPMPNQKKSLNSILKKFDKVDEELIGEKIDSVRKQSGTLKPNEFEVALQALCAFSRKRVVKGLTEACGYRNTPSLSYEIVAHLLKHRFLDVAVNFNNDELLDNAIEEELPNGEDYRFIYTAGHCPKDVNELYTDNRLRKPMYVKCHGTISRPNSLRLEGNNAFVMETAIQKHLTDTFRGVIKHKYANQQEELPLNLIVLGFSMDNVAFNRILREVLTKKTTPVTIWLFEFNASGKQRVRRRIQTQFREFIEAEKLKLEIIPVTEKLPLKKQLTDLWQEITKCFDEPYKPQGIARHRLVNHVFMNYSPVELKEDKEFLKAYLNDRLYLEIAILILQTDGFIHLSQLTGNRAGKFYNLLRKKYDTRHISAHLKAMGLVEYKDFMHNTYHIANKATGINKKTILKHVIRHLCGDILKNTSLKKVIRNRNFSDLSTMLQEKRLGLVNPKYDDIHDNQFRDVKVKDVMNTSLAWVYNYRAMLTPERIDEWDVMLAITEKGRFLYHDLRDEIGTDFSKKKFALVLSRFDQKSKMTAYTEKLTHRLTHLGSGLRFRSWWLHNQHMVIFLKKIPNGNKTPDWEKDWKRVAGFYYSSRMLSRRISPVRVKERDLKKLMTVFAIYHHGAADAFAKETYDTITTRSKVDEVLNELLAGFDKE